MLILQKFALFLNTEIYFSYLKLIIMLLKILNGIKPNCIRVDNIGLHELKTANYEKGNI